MSKAIGGWVRRKDRHGTKYALSYDKEAHLGRVHHMITPSWVILSWREEPLQFQAMPPILKFEQFDVETDK